MAEAFDFEWANKNLFYGTYTRTLSYFSNSDLASSGIPQGDELKLLEPYRKELPPALVHRAVQAAGDRRLGQQPRAVAPRAGAAAAGRLVGEGAQAGRQDRQQMSFTILLDEPSLERVALPYVQTAAEARHRRAGAHGRSGAVPAPDRRLRLRHDHDDLSGERHPRQRAARLLHLRGGQGAGQLQRAGDLRSGGRRAGRAGSSRRRTARR